MVAGMASAVSLLIHLVAVSSLRVTSDVEQAAFHDVGAPSTDCACMKSLQCTECSFHTCPAISSATAMAEGGTDKVNGVAAWQVTSDTGKMYVLKFGGTKKDDAIKAAQLAHALGVATPHQALFDSSSCPALFALSHSDKSLPEAFKKSLGQFDGTEKMLAVQEWADGSLAPSVTTSVETSLWYQLGAIAAFEWLIGKADLFNDVRMNFTKSDTYIEDTASNWGNLIFDRNKVVTIDLSIGMAYTRYAYWEALLKELQVQESPAEIEWVKKVLLPTASLISSKGPDRRERASYVFGDIFNHNSPLIVQLGMVDTLLKALKLQSQGSPLVQTVTGNQMPGFEYVTRVFGEDAIGAVTAIRDKHFSVVQEPWADKVTTAEHHARIRKEALEHFAAAKEMEGKRCCEMTCTRKRSRTLDNWFAREECPEKTRFTVDLFQSRYGRGSALWRADQPRIETSCSDVFEKRGERFHDMCNSICGEEAVKPKIKGFTDVSSVYGKTCTNDASLP